MDRHIRECEFVVMVCTEPYFNRVCGTEQPGVGHGVRWEGNLIYQHIYNAGTLNERFVPVVFEASSSRFVPTPMQGATLYRLDSEEGYERLYARLTRQGRVPKPSLGERRPPQPPRIVKTDPSMYLTGPINIELWDRARWSGSILMWAPELPPVLGLAFKNESAGRKIFEEWRARYGERDIYEELRISIVEGEILGAESGYSIHIGTEPEAAVQRFRAAGFDTDPALIAMITRIQRMTPSPGSENLQQFKRHFQTSKRYLLAPGVALANRSFRPLLDLSIEKRALHLRQVSDIGANDLDAVVLEAAKVPRPNLGWESKS